MAKKQARQDSPTDYPFEPLYRPWSWMLSSFSNVLLFAALFTILYILYRKRKGKGKREVTYRSVETKKVEVLESVGKTTALVTGGSGVLGREVVRCLIEDGGYRVYSLDLTIPESEHRSPDVYSYIQVDITDIDNLKLALSGIEVVFHTAGLTPMFVGHTEKDFYDVNATGTQCVVSACKACGVKRLVHTSTVNVMISSDPNQVLDNMDESSPYPKQTKDAYSGSKTIGEKCVLAANENGSLLTCALRLHQIMTKEVVKASEVHYIGDGLARQQFIPVDTAANVHMLVEKKLRLGGEASLIAGKAYFLCLQDSYSFLELTEFIASERGEVAGSVPLWVATLLVYFNTFVYKVFGRVPVHSAFRIDTLPLATLSYTFSNALGRRDIGWEDKRSWKDVIRQMVQETSSGSESKKEK